MLLNIIDLQKKYSLKLNTILHVGAHVCQEYNKYNNCGASKIFWVEGNPELVTENKTRLNEPQNTIIEAVVSEFDGEIVEFNISNKSQASSILKLGLIEKLFPTTKYHKTITRYTQTLDNIYTKYCNNLEIDLLSLDIQGAELLALKGFSKNLHRVGCIYCEINTKHVYKDSALVEEIDDYLQQYNFSRVETKFWYDHPWGDALYLKNI
jgi:FkbM family methyltransferase